MAATSPPRLSGLTVHRELYVGGDPSCSVKKLFVSSQVSVIKKASKIIGLHNFADHKWLIVQGAKLKGWEEDLGCEVIWPSDRRWQVFPPGQYMPAVVRCLQILGVTMIGKGRSEEYVWAARPITPGELAAYAAGVSAVTAVIRGAGGIRAVEWVAQHQSKWLDKWLAKLEARIVIFLLLRWSLLCFYKSVMLQKKSVWLI